ncbi:hypothetical protein [Saccharothrix yanglingensis]|uniref:Fibronectin type-III domain-containing protein n=1 Tax=Saccharothrix yanglingensis TaxID=659496 RepID=A0ABU0WSS5_9PSEU|nr:hypothetical protein [Saccharothrix yanglingensis]MDQ2582893.1 hypothetical protein [Saccharothrix yanglingensis]
MKLLRRALATLLVTAVAVPVGATPAQAGHRLESVASTALSYTDLRTPFQTHTGGDAPVGAWRDQGGRLHVSEAYYRVDLAPYRDAHLFTATAWVSETAANDCAVPRSTELWLTEDADRPTFARQPRELVRHPYAGSAPACVSGYVAFDVTATLNDALAAGRTAVTFALRMPGGKQWQVPFGRRYDDVLHVNLDFNRPPGAPTGITAHGAPCGSVIGGAAPELTADVTDPDDNWLSGTFFVRDLGEPDAPAREFTVERAPARQLRRTLPAGTLAENRAYEVTARTDDGDATSPMSAPCRFETDFTPPPRPTVSSTDYPEDGGFPGTGGGDVAGSFTFTGSADVAEFEYRGAATAGRVPAVGGTATAVLKPGVEGPQSLEVWALDRAGNRSPARTYGFRVASTAPSVTATPYSAVAGTPREVLVTPSERIPGVVEYDHRLDGGAWTTIPAAPDGTVRFTVLTEAVNPHRVDVRGRTAAGVTTGVGSAYFVVDPGSTSVTSADFPEEQDAGAVGVPGVFELRTTNPAVAAFSFEVDGAAPVLAPATAGAASVTYTPTWSGFHMLVVRSLDAHGGQVVDDAYYFFSVAG